MPRGVYVRTPRAKTPKTIRTLRPGEPRPDWEPYRYPDQKGYVRLRWKVGTGSYVEAREHRLVVAPETGQHVHHVNHVKDDNRPDNLQVLAPHDHGTLHGQERRTYDVALVVELYRAGWSTVAIGRHLQVAHSTIYRALQRAGEQPRTIRQAARLVAIHLDEIAVLALHDTGVRADVIARHFGVSRTPIERVLRDHGRTSHRPGRPARAA